jgi:hypothetical protein
MAKEKRWKKFERLIAAIHAATQENATVKWNEKINGRQFDVTIRFRAGLYDYLTVVECKNYSSAVKVETVESFITKAQDVKANHAIMAAANGFQSGAV